MEKRPPSLTLPGARRVLRLPAGRLCIFWNDGSRSLVSADAAGLLWIDHFTGSRRVRHGPVAAASLSRAAAPSSVASAPSRTVTAPVGGTVARVLAAPGQEVAAGDILVVLELMKMEFSLAAPQAARVDEVRVSAGNAVQKGAVLITFG
jgi:acetyl/propionyl-CoA carboxylase alpha subunit